MALSEKQQENTERKFKLSNPLKRLKALPEETKSVICKVAGLVLMLFTVYTLYCCVSYLFTWKSDYSITCWADISASSPRNAGSAVGLWWSRFLVGGCFGLSAFCIVVFLGLLSVKIFRRSLDSSFLRPCALTLSAAPLFSFVLAFFSSLFGADPYFGGGLGGYAGAEGVYLCEKLIGKIGAGLFLLVLFVVWLLFASGKFARWFSSLDFSRKNKAKNSESERLAIEGGAAEEGVSENGAAENGASENGAAEGNGAGTFGDDGTDSDAADSSDGLDGTDSDAEVGEGAEPLGQNSLEDKFGEDSRGEDAAAKETLSSSGQTSPAEGLEAGEVFSTEGIKELPRIDNRAELERYTFPSLDLLEDYADKQTVVTVEEQQDYINRIRQTLLNFRIKVEDITAKAGPTVTLYKVLPAPGVKYASIKNVQNDIGISLGAKGVRVVKLEDAVGIEVANRKASVVPLKAMLNDESFRETKAELPVAIGCTITRKVKVFDLAQAPHLLVAGATQQGKSVGLNVIVSSLLYAKHPSELKFVFVDPKMVEFTAYKRLLKHYLAVLPTASSEQEEAEDAIIKTPKNAADVLNSLCVEMDERYALLALAGVNKLKDYNEKYRNRFLSPADGHKFLPYIVVVIDEFADLTMSSGFGQEGKALSRGISTAIIRLAQKGRAAGIHLIIATQRPSVSVITGDIKTNFPMRIAFRTVSRIDSMTILDSPGSESLIGRGDMLFYAGVEMERVQCALVETKEIDRITKFIEAQNGYKQCYTTPYYLPTPPTSDDGGGSAGGPIDISKIDDMFADAARLVVSTQRGSTSDLQRKLGLGYARAGRIMDQLEAAGIVGPQEGSKPRSVLVGDYAELEPIITAFTTQNS